MKDYTYITRVKYYETDKMGVVHHSNYIRWMEDARTSSTKQDIKSCSTRRRA